MNENGIEQFLRVTYLGGPTMILEIGGFRIITDPTLDPEGTAFQISEKPLREN